MTTPGNVQGDKKIILRGQPWRIPLSQTSCKLKAETKLTTKRKISPTEPVRQTQPVQNGPIHRSKRLDDISNQNVQLITTSSGKNLLNVQRSGKLGLNRRETITQTENRLRQPSLKPIPHMTKPERVPQSKDNRNNTKGPLTKRSSITIGFRDYSNTGVQQPLRPNTSLSQPAQTR